MSSAVRGPNPRRGMVLITLAVVIIVIVGLLGLSLDLGRVYVAKGELQNYADAAAFAAALKLNGVQSGIDRATTAAGSMNNRWDFATQTISSGNRTVQFGSSSTGTNGSWLSNPSSSEIEDVTHVRVGVTASVPLLFMPMVRGATSQVVNASAVAGKVSTSTIGAGNLLPFAPLAPTPSNTSTFGFVVGSQYTLRWPSSGQPGTPCAGDVALGTGTGSTIARQNLQDPERGYWGSTSTNTIRTWINNGYSSPLSVGSNIELSSGEKNGAKEQMTTRVQSDTDHTSTTYAQYEANVSGGNRVGNGRRIVAVPVITGGGSSTQPVLGFAAFFLQSLSYHVGGNEPFCGTYIGSYTVGANASSGAGVGVTKLRLVR